MDLLSHDAKGTEKISLKYYNDSFADISKVK